MEKLSALPNIGPVIETQLVRAGIETPEALKDCGSREAWRRIHDFAPFT